MKRVWLGLSLLLILALMSSCAGTRAIMQTAPSKPKGAFAIPPLSPVSLEAWEIDKSSLLQRLQSEIYGQMPSIPSASPLYQDRSIAHGAFGNRADIYEWTITAREDIAPFTVVIVKPAKARSAEPVPIILMQNFCPNHNVIPIEGVSKPSGNYFSCDSEGLMADIFGYFFGRYITSPPVDMIMERGYALAVVYPPDFVPDNAERALPILETLSPNSPNRLGAIGAWAWQASQISAALKDSGEFTDVITYGHSRYGKSALVAAAFDPRIDGVIAHQSGTGGASLSRDKPGETVAAITQSYPHWFGPHYSEDRLTIDQHHLLAMIAPRPIMLGNAKRDVWSDPEGAFRAAKGALPVYSLYGSDGLRQDRLTKFDPSADIAFWMRPGTHGVVEEDWPAFLDFLDAHFK